MKLYLSKQANYELNRMEYYSRTFFLEWIGRIFDVQESTDRLEPGLYQDWDDLIIDYEITRQGNLRVLNISEEQ